jgi:hypothetical protein
MGLCATILSEFKNGGVWIAQQQTMGWMAVILNLVVLAGNQTLNLDGGSLISSKDFQTGSGAHPASYPIGYRNDIPGVKQPEREVDHTSIYCQGQD